MEDLYINIFVGILMWGMYLALAVTLLGAEKLAKTLFEGAYAIPVIGGFVVLMLAIPYLIIYGLTSYFIESQALRIGISIIGIALLFVLYVYLDRAPFQKDSTFKELLEAQIYNLKWHANKFLKEKIIHKSEIDFSKNHIEIFHSLEAKFLNELDKRSTNIFLAVIFFIFTYYLFKDNEGFKYFIDYRLSSWLKYLLLITSFFSFLYLYSKYYSLFSRNTYKEIFKLVNFLASEKKYVLLVNDNELSRRYKFSIESKNPWKAREKSEYYYFVKSESGELAYWLNPSLDYKHYKQIATGIHALGVEGFLDNVLKKNKIDVEE
jgi:hypothetical protein